MTQPSHISLPQFEELRALLDEDFVDLIHTYMQDSYNVYRKWRQLMPT